MVASLVLVAIVVLAFAGVAAWATDARRGRQQRRWLAHHQARQDRLVDRALSQSPAQGPPLHPRRPLGRRRGP